MVGCGTTPRKRSENDVYLVFYLFNVAPLSFIVMNKFFTPGFFTISLVQCGTENCSKNSYLINCQNTGKLCPSAQILLKKFLSHSTSVSNNIFLLHNTAFYLRLSSFLFLNLKIVEILPIKEHKPNKPAFPKFSKNCYRK
ncbi:hypothetical protein EGR_04968 [Echinococcus granulosus]|uniref:Uncharacterized protein n=1 Tax=Echinococcus granulosus TaxID=6210 RepID=W6UFC1_ECHGR|nr:hypothetical protein EGR_04968 [Echinococcus granulosus]EUB60115.1 hypothetical protein EGR_04968 [Echinococcus granulosus]